MKHRALFLDRDGTLVHPRHYPFIQTCEHRSHEIGANANAWLRSVRLLHRNKCCEADLAYRPPTWQLTLEPDRADSTLCT